MRLAVWLGQGWLVQSQFENGRAHLGLKGWGATASSFVRQHRQRSLQPCQLPHRLSQTSYAGNARVKGSHKTNCPDSCSHDKKAFQTMQLETLFAYY